MEVARTAEVVWYATGRFYAQTAWFTFAAKPFKAPSIDNGGLSIGLDATGEFSVYLRDEPGASFDDPDSFFAGRNIATFARVAIVPTTKVAASPATTLLSNVFTARLVESTPFDFCG